jgi:hypothetical protein
MSERENRRSFLRKAGIGAAATALSAAAIAPEAAGGRRAPETLVNALQADGPPMPTRRSPRSRSTGLIRPES